MAHCATDGGLVQQTAEDRRFAQTVADFLTEHQLDGFIHVGEGRPDAALGSQNDCFLDKISGRFYALKSAKFGWGAGAFVRNDQQVFHRIKMAVARQQATGER